MALHKCAWFYTSVHGFTQRCMVLHKCAWFYILQYIVYTLTHGFTQVCMVLYMHGLHIDAWFYTREHGFTHCSALFTH